MARNPNGNIAGGAGNDTLWGTAIVLGDGTYDNSPDIDTANHQGALRGYDGDDIIFGDIYNNGKDYNEGDQAYGGDGNDTIYGDGGSDDPNWQTSKDGGSDTLFGDAGDDRLYGQAGNDILDGGTGNDLLVGGIGSDTLRGGAGNDILWAGIQNGILPETDRNTLFGDAGKDILYGSNGVDTMDGGEDDDRMYGGGGGDQMEGGNGSDVMKGGDGDDRIDGGGYYATAQGDGNDVLYGENGNDQLFGFSGNDRLYGGDGNDILDGGGGNDLFDGGAGADLYRCSSGGNDTYVFGAGDSFQWDYYDDGVDLIRASISYVLGAFHENLTLTGSSSLKGTGNAMANVIIGNSGANVLDGKEGADTLQGGAGNDIYYVDNAGDNVVEADGQGTDKIVSTVSYTLAGRYVETLALTGSSNISATGNKLANVLAGNTGNNVLNGMLGNDTLTGKGGKDIFVFDQKLGASNVDHITDFSATDDTIRLENAVFVGLSTGTLAASAFVANSSGLAADSSDRIIYETDTGKLFFDRDGSGSAYAPVQFAVLDNKTTITYQDFVVV